MPSDTSIQQRITKDSTVEEDLTSLMAAANIAVGAIQEMWLSIPLTPPRLLETIADFNLTLQRLNIKRGERDDDNV
jgi:hypothetical protein